MGKISEIEDATPIKIGLHAFHNHFYLHEYFEPILFFDPHRKALAFLCRVEMA